jgi:hypothetical protein
LREAGGRALPRDDRTPDVGLHSSSSPAGSDYSVHRIPFAVSDRPGVIPVEIQRAEARHAPDLWLARL